MIRIVESVFLGINDEGKAVAYVDGYCNSVDEKPTDAIATGSKLTEADTGDVYMFDEESTSWAFMYSIKATEEPAP